MAGETRGELAEAIAKVALERALSLMRRSATVFWQESPDGAVIKPDFTIGTDLKRPEVLVLVNASGSPKESEKKYWRNVGEVFDTKSRLASAPAILNLVFQSEIKRELIRLTEVICDSTCLVDRDPNFGPAISEWLDANHAAAPSKREERVELVRKAMTRGGAEFDPSFAKAVDSFAKKLASLLFSEKPELKPLWDLCRADYETRRGKPVRTAKITMLRRGLGRWLVFDDSLRRLVLASHLEAGRIKLKQVPTYAEPLGMLKRGIGYLAIPPGDETASDMTGTTSRDLRLAADFFRDAAKGDSNAATQALEKSLVGAPDEMRKAAELLRLMPSLIDGWHRFVISEWDRLITPTGCFELLIQCSIDPSMNREVSVSPESRVWLWDHLLAIIRAAYGRNNDFGYSAMVSVFKSGQDSPALRKLFRAVLATLDGRALKAGERWIEVTLPKSAEPGRRGFQDWLAGTKDVSPVVIAAFAFALSTTLRQIRSPNRVDTTKILASHAYALWNKLLTHQDFEPLPALIEAACGSTVSRASAPSIMGEIGGATVQDAGKMPVFAFKHGLIFWQSAHGGHVNDKRKEVCGRARALKYTYHQGNFRQRTSARRMFLVLDGEWRDEDLVVFHESGWDAVFYPDETDQLAKAID